MGTRYLHRRLHVRKLEENRWQVSVLPQNGHEGFMDSFYRKRFARYGWYYCNDHNGVMFRTQRDMIEYLLRNF